MSYAIEIGGDNHYYKISKNGKVFYGKVKGETIPHGAVPVSLREWGEGSYGKKAWADMAGQIGKVVQNRRSELIVENDFRKGLPNPDSPEFKQLIKNQTKGKIW